LSKTGLYELNARLDEQMVEQAIKDRERSNKRKLQYGA